MRHYTRYTLFLFFIGLSACSTLEQAPTQPKKNAKAADGPPLVDIDVAMIPNAIPKPEPRSKVGNPPIYEVFGKQYRTMTSSTGYQAKGTASWYGRKFHGQPTSSGEPYDMFAMTAAHRSLPLPTYAKVKNLHNGKEIIVKINDRGPFVADRIIDLSYVAAKKLGLHSSGVGTVHITAIDPVMWQKEQTTLNKKLLKERHIAKTDTLPKTDDKKTSLSKTQKIATNLK